MKVEIPGFVKLYDRYRAQGFEIVGLITEDPISNVPAFAKDNGMNYTGSTRTIATTSRPPSAPSQDCQHPS